ncbi:MAG: chaperone NapD [Rhodospirillales bacterium]|jgi:nitrate reductase NapD|nr:chaperone NapD [Rhodospirillales bacterium]MDK9720307.1 chaperone NapD [Rhodospirillales bacterium]
MRIDRFIQASPEEVGQTPANICGVLVHANPRRQSEVVCALKTISGVEVHRTAEDGRIVITVEDTAQSWAGETIKQIQELQGVLNASLVYHHFDESQVRGESFQ